MIRKTTVWFVGVLSLFVSLNGASCLAETFSFRDIKSVFGSEWVEARADYLHRKSGAVRYRANERTHECTAVSCELDFQKNLFRTMKLVCESAGLDIVGDESTFLERVGKLNFRQHTVLPDWDRNSFLQSLAIFTKFNPLIEEFFACAGSFKSLQDALLASKEYKLREMAGEKAACRIKKLQLLTRQTEATERLVALLSAMPSGIVNSATVDCDALLASISSSGVKSNTTESGDTSSSSASSSSSLH